MAINPEDVKLYESQRLTDEDDGGGRATGVVVVDGQINNLFPDISRIDRTVGDVALRKAFVGVATNNADVYLGVHAIIVEPPEDDNVHVVLFEATSEPDERVDARNKVESYVVQSTAASVELLGNQYAGQRQIVVIQRLESELPEIGEVYHLKDGANDQYVRITSMDDSEVTFSYLQNGVYRDFERRQITLGISAPLEVTFPGGQFTPTGTTTPKSTVSNTNVADAARYYGVSKSVDPIAIGDVSIKAASVYANLVPSAQTETSLLDQAAGGQAVTVKAAATATITDTDGNVPWVNSGLTFYCSRPVVPGSMTLTVTSSTYTDNGIGQLIKQNGAVNVSVFTIDYQTGIIQGVIDSGSIQGDSSMSAVYVPGAPLSGRVLTGKIAVTIGNRGYNYTLNLADAKPRPGTLVVSYRALGKWYSIRDIGGGELSGDGAGSVNYTTGSAGFTLEALPDVDTQILYSYSQDIEDDVTIHEGAIGVTAPSFDISIGEGVLPGSVTITYTSGSAQTVTDDGAGALTGDGTGTIDYANGTIRLNTTDIPDKSTVITIDYQNGSVENHSASPIPDGAGTITGTLPNGPLLAGSISLSYQRGRLIRGQQTTELVTLQDDGAGGWVGATGTINYTTGDYSIDVVDDYNAPVYRASGMPGYLQGGTTVSAQETIESSFTFKYQGSSTPHSPDQVLFTCNQVTFKLLGNSLEPVIPGSVIFTWDGSEYIDRDGIIYKDIDHETGAGTSVGTIDHSQGLVVMDDWAANASSTVTLKGCATVAAAITVPNISFRTPGAPLRPSSLQVTVTAEDGTLITATADGTGAVTGTNVTGTVNYETGTVDLEFDDGADPVFVYADTARYNAVLYSYLPLDADLIGLDPVRLPSDGRVPIYRPGDVIVLSHTTQTNVGTPTDGQVVNLARDYQADIVVVDSLGVALDPAEYTADKTAGAVTFANPLTLQDADTNPLTPPMTIRDRIEHMSVLNDVQIGGELSFIAPVAHDYPANETVISSALVWGDVNTRYYSFFKQKTWSSGSPNWTDERVGDDTTANYDDINYPIELANNGAVTEKWAIVFTSSTAFQVVGQNLGIIATGTTAADIAPVNPNTGNPYFVMRASGWGSGWASGNAVRFNTDGCLAPVWIARTTLSGQAETDNDQFVLQIRGDAD